MLTLGIFSRGKKRGIDLEVFGTSYIFAIDSAKGGVGRFGIVVRTFCSCWLLLVRCVVLRFFVMCLG